ncbi:MAG TPA: hypothetical protein VEZ42_13905 [Pseudonocardia sp.]|nr:hypothetical protein [Pseudonocardia sp.]
MSRNRLLPPVAVLLAALALSACTGGDGQGGAPAEPAGAPPAAAAPPPPGQPALLAKEVDDLGTIVVDEAGFTLYRFDEDDADPPTSTCVEECATRWPPAVVDPAGRLTVDGVQEAAVGLLRRPDGTTQLTIAGWAVYRFSGDTAPGMTEGQGAGGTWYAVTPDGSKATPVG